MRSFIRMATKLTLIRTTGRLQQHDHAKESEDSEGPITTDAGRGIGSGKKHGLKDDPGEIVSQFLPNRKYSHLPLSSWPRSGSGQFSFSGRCDIIVLTCFNGSGE